MKQALRNIALLVLFFGGLTLLSAFEGSIAHGQEKPKEPTIAELKLQLAQKDLVIADLKVKLTETQNQLIGILHDQAKADFERAQRAVQDATPKPEAKK